MRRVQQGVSEYQLFSPRQTDKIVGFLQQNSEASASWECGVLQSGPMGKTYTATGTHSCDLSGAVLND